MSIETETTEVIESTNVVEEGKPHTGTPEQPLTKEQKLENDNWRQREEIRQYKEQVETLTGKFTTLETGYTELKTALAAKEESEAKSAKDKALNTALDEAGIVDEKYRNLAVLALGDNADFSEGLKKVIEDYPVFVSPKTIPLPDTGKARSQEQEVPDSQKLASGLAKLMNK